MRYFFQFYLTTWLKNLRSFLSNLERPTIIYYSYLPLYLEESQPQNFILKALQNKLLATHPDDPTNVVVATLQSWVDDGYGLVIVYPGPKHGYNIFRKLKEVTPPITEVDQLPILPSDYGEYKKVSK